MCRYRFYRVRATCIGYRFGISFNLEDPKLPQTLMLSDEIIHVNIRGIFKIVNSAEV